MDFKNLNRFRTGGTGTMMQLGLPIPKTPDGRVYRYSPNEDAHPRHFVLGNFDPAFEIADGSRARMKLQPRSNQTVCPYSGVIADDEQFTHPDDREAAIEMVKDAAVRDVEDMINKAFSGFNNRSSGNGFLRMETKFTPAAHRPKPRFARRDLLRELVCDHCGRDYGVFAIGLFCPDCGAPNLRLHFAREVELVRQQVELATAKSEEAEELAYRLLGNAHEDVLTAFEATQKAVYLYGKAIGGAKAGDFKPVRNDFQNVDFAQKRFAELGIDPVSCLDPDARAVLKLNIQKRHIIGHNLGVMDEKFVSHAEGARVGETVRLVASDVIAFAEGCQHIVAVLDDWLTGSSVAAAAIPVSSIPVEEPEIAMPASQVDLIDSDLSPIAQQVGLWIATHSENGMTAFVSGAKVQAAFPGEQHTALAEAIAELELEGHLKVVHRGDGLPTINPTVDLFATFDRHAIGSDPLADAAELTKKILAGKDQIAVAELHAETGWSLRRFNPALGLVLPNVDDRRVSRELNSVYPTGHFFLMATDRVSLKRFLSRMGG